MINKSIQKYEKISFFIWPIIAAFLSFAFNTNFLVSAILFFGIPSLYLSIRNFKMVKKIAIFSLPAFIIVIVIDYICEITGIWFIPTSVFGYRFLGFVTIDIMIWFYLYTYFIVSYHEYFLNHHYKDKPYYPKLKYLFILFGSALVMFFVAFFINRAWLHIPYFYLIFGMLFAIIPIVTVLLKFPNLTTKFVKTGVYFFFTSLIYEITALQLGQWTFPGTYFIGYVTFFNIQFPFEEFFFWIILGALAILSFYEFFDEKNPAKD